MIFIILRRHVTPKVAFMPYLHNFCLYVLFFKMGCWGGLQKYQLRLWRDKTCKFSELPATRDTGSSLLYTRIIKVLNKTLWLNHGKETCVVFQRPSAEFSLSLVTNRGLFTQTEEWRQPSHSCFKFNLIYFLKIASFLTADVTVISLWRYSLAWHGICLLVTRGAIRENIGRCQDMKRAVLTCH